MFEVVTGFQDIRRPLASREEAQLNPVTQRLISQLVGAATSVGANYCEADDAVSKKDFRHLSDAARPLWQEAKELHLIFAKIWRG